MAAAYSNSIQALNGIYGALDQIIRLIDRPDSPEKTKEKNENTVKNLNRGGLSADTLAADKSSTGSTVPTAASIKDISSALLSLPPAIKAIAGLSDRSINKVIGLINELSMAFTSTGTQQRDAARGAETLMSLARSLVLLQDIKFFQLLIKLKALEKIDFEKTLGKSFDGLVKSYKVLDGISKKDMDNYIEFTNNISNLSKTVKEFSKVSALMPVFNLSVMMFTPAMTGLIKLIKKMPDKSKMEVAIESSKMVSNLATSVAVIIAASIGLGIAIQRGDPKAIMTGIGISLGIITLLSGLALAIEILGRKSPGVRREIREINRFINSLTLTTGLIFGLAILYSSQKESINQGLVAVGSVLLAVTALAVGVSAVSKFLNIRREMNEITKFMMGMMLITGGILLLGAYAQDAKPVMVEGLKTVMTVLTAVMGLAILTGVLMRFVNPVAMGSVMGFIGFSMLAVLGTFLLGSVISTEGGREALLYGLGATAAVMVGYTAIALGAAFLGMLVMEGAPFLKQVTLFAGFSLAIVLGTMFIGTIISVGREYLVLGLGGTLGTIIAYAAITKAVGAMTKDLALAMPQLRVLGLFTAGCLGVAFSTILLGLAMEKAGWWTVAALGLLGAIIGSTYGLAQLISRLHRFTSLEKAIPELKMIGLFLAAAELLAGGVVGLAYAIKGLIGGEDWVRGAAAIAGTFTIVAGIIYGSYWVARLVSRNKEILDQGVIDIKSTLLFMGGAELLAGGIIGLAYAYRELGEDWTERLGYIGAAFGLVTSIITGGTIVAKELAKTKSDMDKGVIDIKSPLLFMGGMELLAGGILGIAYAFKELGQTWGERLEYVGVSFALVGAVMAGGVLIAKELDKTRATIDKGIIDIKSPLLLMGGAELLAGGVIGLAYALREFLGGDWKNTASGSAAILGVFGLITAIIIGAEKVAETASQSSKNITKGAVSLLLAESIIAGAGAVLFGVITLGQYGKGKENETLATLTMMTAILIQAGVMANTAAKINKKLTKGITALALAEALILGSNAVLLATIGVGQVLKGKEVQTLEAMGMADLIIAATGALAFTAGKFKTTISKGIPVMALVEALALGSVLVLGALVKVSEAGDGRWGQVLAALGTTEAIIVATGAVAFAAGALIVGPQALWFAAGSAGVAACEALAYAGSKMLGAMIEVVDAAGDSESLKTKSIAAFNTMKSIISEMGGLTAMSLRRAAGIIAGAAAYKRIINVVTGLSGSVTSLIALSNILESTGTTTEKLKTDISNLLSAMSPNIFLTLFNDESLTSQLIKLRSGRKSYESMINLVSSAVDVYMKMVTGLKDKAINTSELSNVASTIMTSVEQFATMLNTISIKREDKKDAKRLSVALTSLIQPISDFAELISKYSGDGSTLKVITYDEKGYAREGKSINVMQTASTIIAAVTKFCEVLYKDENRNKWEQLAMGSGKDNPSPLEKGIGVFASIIEPVSKFAELLTLFDAKDNDLIIPEYDNEGRLVSSRTVNVRGVASVIAGAVTTFIEELYVNHKEQWKTVLDSLNQIDPSIMTSESTLEKTGNKAGLQEAIGIFGEILNPVLSFASVLLKFGSDKANNLTVLDEQGKPHSVDVAKIASGISEAVTTFISMIAGIFQNQQNLQSIEVLKQNSLTVLDVLNGFIENISSASSIDSNKLSSVTTSIEAFVSNLNTSVKSINETIPEDVLNTFTSSLSSIQASLKSFVDEGILAEDVTKQGASIATFVSNLNILLAAVNNEKVTEFETAVTNLKDFISTSVTALIKISDEINVEDFVTSNTALANTIKDSYMSLFNSVAGEQQRTVIDGEVTLFRTFIKGAIDSLTFTIMTDDELAAFETHMTNIKNSLSSSVLALVNFDLPADAMTKYADVTTSIRSGIDKLLASDVPSERITNFSVMYNTLIKSIHTLINEQEITNVDAFNKNYDTLMKNLESSSQDSKVKKINNLSAAVVKSSNSLKGFDDTLNKGNSTRIKELNSFGKAVGNITDKLRSAQTQINELRDLFSKLESADANNITEIADQVSRMTGSGRTGFFGGGTQAAPTIDVNALAVAVGRAVAQALSNTSLDMTGVSVKITDNATNNEVTTTVQGQIDVQSEYETGIGQF